MKSSTKILGASAALGLAIALSAGSTFAWFTKGNSNVQVDSFNLTATTKTDGAQVDIALTVADNNTNATNGMFGTNAAFPTTASTETGWGETIEGKLYSLLSTELGALTFKQGGFQNADGTATTKGSITFRVGFRSNAPVKIYLDNTAKVDPGTTTPKTINGTEDNPIAKEILTELGNGKYTTDTQAFTVGNANNGEGSITARAANAARVMFEEKSVASATKYIWCPNEYYYDGGEFNGTDATGKAKTGKTNGFYKNNLASDYVYAVGEMKKDVSFDEVDLQATTYKPVVQETYSDCVKPADQTDKTVLATLAKPSAFVSTDDAVKVMPKNYIVDSTNTYYYAFVDVTIWLEGTDGDCFDAIFGDAMSILLAFKGEE